MGKISKSDKIDKEQESKDKDWFSARPLTKHFTVGSNVLYDGYTWEIYKYNEAPRGVYLRRFRDDNSFKVVFLHNPSFMQGHDLSIFKEQ